jgi:uncharacterized RDD family membrane protein YckC
MADPVAPAPAWKRVVASILDFFTVFFIAGLLIAAATGNQASSGIGFNLSGWPAALLFAVIAAYFFIGRRYAGGTLWDRVFGIRRPQPY